MTRVLRACTALLLLAALAACAGVPPEKRAAIKAAQEAARAKLYGGAAKGKAKARAEAAEAGNPAEDAAAAAGAEAADVTIGAGSIVLGADGAALPSPVEAAPAERIAVALASLSILPEGARSVVFDLSRERAQTLADGFLHASVEPVQGWTAHEVTLDFDGRETLSTVLVVEGPPSASGAPLGEALQLWSSDSPRSGRAPGAADVDLGPAGGFAGAPPARLIDAVDRSPGGGLELKLEGPIVIDTAAARAPAADPLCPDISTGAAPAPGEAGAGCAAAVRTPRLKTPPLKNSP